MHLSEYRRRPIAHSIQFIIVRMQESDSFRILILDHH